MSIRLNKEIKIEPCKHICVKYGSVNKDNPQVIYVAGKMWLIPTYEGDFETPIRIMCSKFKKGLKRILNDSGIFEKKYILDFDINPENFTNDKKTFSSISVFVRQKTNHIIGIKEIKNEVMLEIGYLFKEFEKDLIENDFIVSKTKK